MPALKLNPALSLISAFGRISSARPLRTLLRTTGYKLRPPRPLPFTPTVVAAQSAVIASGAANLSDRATILCERRKGPIPTIVLGGFVPDAPEQVFLLRGFLLKSGSVYYVNYPSESFSAELLFAQLEDLVEELARLHGQRPVIFSVSFGVGVVMEWLKRARQAGRRIQLRGLLLISPVACMADLIVPGSAKATTLLGRAIKPFIEMDTRVDHGGIEKARGILTKMFEAGAQNKETLSALMTRGELHRLREAVMGTIQRINPQGAYARVQSLKKMEPPSAYFSQSVLPLSDAPTLILYAEKESSVIVDHSPTRFALQSAHRAYFPHSHYRVISNRNGSPVQHASLIFHCFNFLPAISAFYKHLRTGKIFKAA